MNIIKTDIDQNWAEGTTTVWFDVDGVSMGVCVEGPDHQLLDSEGYPIDACNDHDHVLRELTPLVKEALDAEANH